LVAHRQQQIGLQSQQAGEVGAHNPPPLISRAGARNLSRENSSRKDLLGLGFEAIAAEFVEAIVDIVVDILR